LVIIQLKSGAKVNEIAFSCVAFDARQDNLLKTGRWDYAKLSAQRTLAK
jgi:hypothetical protein